MFKQACYQTNMQLYVFDAIMLCQIHITVILKPSIQHESDQTFFGGKEAYEGCCH